MGQEKKVEKKKVKVEDIIQVQDKFKAQFPKAAIGIADLKHQGIVRIEARVACEEDAKDIPKEFEGYDVRTVVVSQKQYEQFKRAMTGNLEK